MHLFHSIDDVLLILLEGGLHQVEDGEGVLGELGDVHKLALGINSDNE